MDEHDLYDIERDMVKWEESMELYADIQGMFNEYACITDVEYLVNNTRLGTNIRK